MKRSVLKWVAGVTASVGLAIGTSCSFPAQDSQNVALSDISSELSFASISRQAYMGGSVLYNPDDLSASQLANGVTIAVRLGMTNRTDIDDDQAIFTDNLDYERYGYLQISSIDKEQISFLYTQYDKTGEAIVQNSYTLKKGETVDLNGDDLPDLTYTIPIVKRPGQKKALWLTFLSSQETLNTAMFSVIPEQYVRSVYPAGLIGINPDGRYIVNKYEIGSSNRAVVQGIVSGDYVLDSMAGNYKKFVGKSSYKNARSIDDSELESTDSNVENTDFTFSLDDFANYISAIDFLAEFPTALTQQYTLSQINEAEAVDILNVLLHRTDFIETVAEEKNIILEDDVLEVLAAVDSLSERELVSLNRMFLDNAFAGESPAVDLSTDSITDILPLASVTLGGDVSEEDDDSNERAATYSEYDQSKRSIRKEFDSYKSLGDLPLINKISNIDKTEYRKSLEKIDATVKFGLAGKYSITWSNMEGTLAAIAFFQAETTATFSKAYKSEKPIYVKQLAFSQDLKDFNKHIQIGPIPFSVGLSGRIEIPYTLSGSLALSSQMFMGVIGLYGAKVTVGANYGTKWVKWFKIWRKWIYRPSVYVNPYANAGLINRTAYYVGPVVQGSILPLNFTAKGSAVISPTFVLTPKVGLCENTIWAGVETSNIVDLGLEGTLSTINKQAFTLEAYVDYRLKLHPAAAVEVTLPVINKKWKKEFPNLPTFQPVKKRLKTWKII